MLNEPDIAIVGAGAAGIAAARRLVGSGYTTLVLEALPRVGGRSWTHKTEGAALDLGCGWLHSADRNPWTRIATESGYEIDSRRNAWGQQYRDLGFSPSDQEAARQAFASWSDRLAIAPSSDCAADLLDKEGRWTAYLQAMSGFISGDDLERISVRDYKAYDDASTGQNWRVVAGYGTLIAASLPASTGLQLNTPIEQIDLRERRVMLQTPRGRVRARAVIVTASSNVIAGDGIIWPSAFDSWRAAAARLPLGNNEKLFLEIIGNDPFFAETNVLGDPLDAATGVYYIRPFGWPVIECFLGGAGARAAEADGSKAAFARAIDQLAALFGTNVRANLRPLAASNWAATSSIRGAYSHALPGHASARQVFAQPFDDRVFFAGEATHETDFSTAHGAYESGVRAAEEAIGALSRT